MSIVHSTRITSGFITKSNIANVSRAREVPYDSSITLLANGTVGTTSFIDSSPNNRTITRLGDTTTSNTQTKFGNVIYFDGTGDSLRYEYTADHNLGTSNWTTEAWVYLQLTADSSIWSLNTTAVADAYASNRLAVRTDGSAVLLCASAATSWINTSNVAVAGQITANTWHHIACVRQGSDFSCYVNGKRTGGYTSTASINNFNQQSFVGSSRSNTLPVHTPMRGYMTNFRHTSAAVYTSNFTPNTDALSASGFFPKIEATILLKMDEAEGATDWADSSVNAVDFVTIGNTTTGGNLISSNAQSKWGTTSLLSTGTNGFGNGVIRTGYISDFNIVQLTRDWTMEGWFYFLSLPSSSAYASEIISLNSNTSGTAALRITIWNNGAIRILCANSSGGWIDTTFSAANAVVVNTWHHIAAVRENVSGTPNYRIYVDGNQKRVYSSTSAATTIQGNLVVCGWETTSPQFSFNGYVDGVRWINGACLYPGGSTFTPPTELFGNTVASISRVISNNTYGLRKNY